MSNYTIKTQKGIDAIKDYSEMSEMKAYVGENELRIFLQQGFFQHEAASGNLHNHKYCEIHIVFCGSIDFFISGKRITVNGGQGIIIPTGEYHSRMVSDPSQTKVCAYQAAMNVTSADIADLDGCAELLKKEIEQYLETGKCVKLASLLGLICSYFYKESVVLPRPIDDREFIIYEFFANNYDKDVSLADIALQLRLSEKQAERLIIRSTGMSFRRQIVAKRIENAKMLVKTEGISLAKAAERVGYQSYSGFWKALQSYEEEKDLPDDQH